MVFKISDVINFMTVFYFCSDYFLSRALGAETGLRSISCYGITSPRERFGALQINFGVPLTLDYNVKSNLCVPIFFL